MQRINEYFEVVVFSSDGSPLDWSPQNDIMVLDMERMPAFEHRPMILTVGYGCVRLPCADGPFALGMPLNVAGFGHGYVYADNEGKGYDHREVNGKRLNLNLEFARSRLAAVKAASATWGDGSFRPSLGCKEAIAEAATLLEDAENIQEPAGQARRAMSSLARSMQAGETLVIERARSRIISQRPRRDFLFGCNGFGYAKLGERYAELFQGVFNYVTAPFYRKAFVEPVQGVRDYSAAETICAWAARAGMQVKGHPLIWLFDAGTPDWLRDRSYEEVRASHLDYVGDSVERFAGKIDRWDIINEAHSWNNIHRWPYEKLIEITEMASRTVHDRNPRAQRVVNLCFTWSEYAGTGWGWNGISDDRARSTLEHCKDLLAADVQFEAIGLQMYDPSRDLFEIDRHIESFCHFGKKVHITEAGISSADSPIVTPTQVYVPNRMHWHGRPWSEQEQADWVEGFYTICYAKPEVEALTWWDFTDPAFIPHGGFLDEQLRPKEGYRRLKRLMDSWR